MAYREDKFLVIANAELNTHLSFSLDLWYPENNMDTAPIICPFCHKTIALADARFCPYCGKTLRLNTSIGKQVGIYLISLFLPPLGFAYTWKYLRVKGDVKARNIGIVATILTVIAIVASIWLWNISMNFLNQSLQSSLGGFSIY